MTRVPRRSASALAVDELLLDAGLAEIVDGGIDRLGMAPVARQAGLTTGALYARYENATELAVSVWERRVRDDLRSVLRTVLDTVAGRGVALGELARRLAAPTPSMRAAIEFLVAARRVEELGELVGPDLREWFADWTAGVDEQAMAWVIGPAAMVLGSLLYMPNTYDTDLWELQLDRLQRADHEWRPTAPRTGPAPAVPARPDTGDEGRDALIDSALEIVARSGVERATVIRVARRAGFTSGGLFTRYPTKLALLLDAVDVIQLAIFVNDTRLIHQAPRGRGSDVAQSVLDAMFHHARDVWRPFRVEIYLAARHYPPLAEVLVKDHMASLVHETGMRSLPERERNATNRAGDFFPLGLFVLDQHLPELARVDLRPVFHAWDLPDRS
ncbi:MAG TPA: TetR/AcrR family transcriptional regulator [Acidimicrobiales bacterium]